MPSVWRARAFMNVSHLVLTGERFAAEDAGAQSFKIPGRRTPESLSLLCSSYALQGDVGLGLRCAKEPRASSEGAWLRQAARMASLSTRFLVLERRTLVQPLRPQAPLHGLKTVGWDLTKSSCWMGVSLTIANCLSG